MVVTLDIEQLHKWSAGTLGAEQETRTGHLQDRHRIPQLHDRRRAQKVRPGITNLRCSQTPCLKSQRYTSILAIEKAQHLADWVAHSLKAAELEHTIETHASYTATIDKYLSAWLGESRSRSSSGAPRAVLPALGETYAGSTVGQLYAVIRTSVTLATKRGKTPANVPKLFLEADANRVYTTLAGTEIATRGG